MYDSSRPSIPAEIRRAVEVESGHACAIKGCSEHTYLEIHHIDENRENNTIENLILLCDKHHKMAHAKIIDRKALRAYKRILSGSVLSIDSLITLLGEIFGAEMAKQLCAMKNNSICVILNPITINELQPYLKEKWLSLQSTGSICSMGCGSRIGGHFEELKHPYGIGNGFTLIYHGEN